MSVTVYVKEYFRKLHGGLLTETEVDSIPHGRIIVHNSILLNSKAGCLHPNPLFQMVPDPEIFWDNISWPRQNT